MPSEPINPGEVFRARCRGSVWGERFENVVHFELEGSNAVGPHDLAIGVRNFFLNQLRAIISEQVKYDMISISRVVPNPHGFETQVAITPLFGAATGDTFPNQMAYLLKLYTGFTFRHRKGRIYLPGIPRTHFALNGWTQTATTQMESIRSILLSEFGVGGGTNFLLGVFTRGDHDTRFVGIDDLVWAGYPAVQRSRRPTIN